MGAGCAVRGVRKALLLLIVAVAACGRAEWREADERLNASVQDARGAGFEPLAGPYNTFGAFREAGTTSWRVHLEAHADYVIAAACTTGCDSLGFELAEPHGTTVATDSAAGPLARADYSATEEGDFTVTFTYGACAVERCRWVAQVYSRRSPH